MGREGIKSRLGELSLPRLWRLSSNPVRRTYLALSRARHPGPRLLAISIPKSGTHLLKQCLEEMPGFRLYHDGVLYPGVLGPTTPVPVRRRIERRRAALTRMGGGCFALVHLPHSEEAERFLAENNFALALMIRDPRDVLVSYYYFARLKKRHSHHAVYNRLGEEEALRVAIKGHPELGVNRGIAGRIGPYLPWLRERVHLVRFEDLVGERGGGSGAAQRQAVEGLAALLGIELTEAQRNRICESLGRPRGRTLRKGRIGAWRTHFTEDHKRLFKEEAGQYLIDLGYESDYDW